jgi:hypothetical protein
VDGEQADPLARGQQHGTDVTESDQHLGILREGRPVQEAKEPRQAVPTSRGPHRPDRGIAEGRIEVRDALRIGSGEMAVNGASVDTLDRTQPPGREHRQARLEASHVNRARRAGDDHRVTRAQRRRRADIHTRTRGQTTASGPSTSDSSANNPEFRVML